MASGYDEPGETNAVSVIFITIAVIAALLACLTIGGALLIVVGLVRLDGSSAKAEEKKADPTSAVPTVLFEPNPPGRRVPAPTDVLDGGLPGGPGGPDPSTVGPYRQADVPGIGGGRPTEQATEMFATNVGDLAQLGLDDPDERP